MTDAKANREARLNTKPTAQPQSAQQGPETQAAAGDAIVAVLQQQLQERDTQLAQLQDEYARLMSYMQLQRDQKQGQHAAQLALMATDHVRRLDVHEEGILKLREQNAVLQMELARVKGVQRSCSSNSSRGGRRQSRSAAPVPAPVRLHGGLLISGRGGLTRPMRQPEPRACSSSLTT